MKPNVTLNKKVTYRGKYYVVKNNRRAPGEYRTSRSETWVYNFAGFPFGTIVYQEANAPDWHNNDILVSSLVMILLVRNKKERGQPNLSTSVTLTIDQFIHCYVYK